MDQDELKPVYCPVDQLEASSIQQALTDQGIPSHLEGENQAAWTGGGFIGNTGRWRMRLLVRVRDLEKAREIIENGAWPTSG